MGNALSATLPEDWITIDMVNRFTFCPRLFHLRCVEGRWEDYHFTLEGKAVHRRVDRIDQVLPETTGEPTVEPTEGDPPPEIARSVSLAAADLGLMGKLDLVSCDPEGWEAVPVETKRGRVPNVPLSSTRPSAPKSWPRRFCSAATATAAVTATSTLPAAAVASVSISMWNWNAPPSKRSLPFAKRAGSP